MAFHESLNPLTILLVGVIFILFFLAFRKALSVVKNAVIITIAAIVFPFLVNLIGFAVASDVNSILFYITFGLSVYFVYMFGKSFYTILDYAEKTGKKVYSPYAKKVDELNAKGKKSETKKESKKAGNMEEKSQKKQKPEDQIDKPKFVSAKHLKPLKEEEYYVYGKEKKEDEE